MIRAYIIDDEPNAVQVLDTGLSQYETVKVTGFSHTLRDGLKAVRKLRPDLLFLDISLPDGEGFDLLEIYNNPDLDTVFYTAHAEHAIRAVRTHAFDYLLKPLDPGELNACITKVQQRRDSIPPVVDELAVHTMDGVELFPFDHIVYCTADNNYAGLHLTDGREIVLSKPLKQVEDVLPYPPFLRIHQSTIVNGRFIKRYIRSENSLILKNGTSLAVSQSRKHGLNLAMRNMRHL